MATFFSASADQRDLAAAGDMFHHYTTSNPYSDSPTGGLMPFPATIVSEGHVAHCGDGRDEPASFVNARDGPTSGAGMGLQTQLLMANASTAQHQGLSLSLGTQGVPVSLYQYRQAGMAAASLLSPGQTTTASRSAQSIYIQNSKYLKAARELLDEVVNVRDAIKRKGDKNQSNKDSGEGKDAEKSEEKAEEHEGNSSAELTPSERQDLQNKVSALMALLDQVDRKYRHYHHQMQIVMSSFDAVAGAGAARPYTALALQTISRHFRSLRDAIGAQVQSLRRSLGEKDTSAQGGGLSRLRYIDHQLRQQRALQQLGMMQGGAWRPQRGLPERSVSILRAWLFEHFLHPYPKDSDKIMLAKQTGLTRSQVSNWFINARVRLWKPMVEEMYLEETKDQDGGNDEGKSGGGTKSGDTSNGVDGVTPRADGGSGAAMSKAAGRVGAEGASSAKGVGGVVHGSTLLELAGDQHTAHPGFYEDEGDDADDVERRLKKARGDEPGAPFHSHHVHDMAALHAQAAAAARQQHEEVSHRELLMKFMESGGGGAGARDQHHQDGGGYSLFAPGPYGQFGSEPFAFAGNGGVSLTLGLPHGAGGGAEQTASFLMGSSASGDGGSHGGAGGYDMNMQSTKSFAAQLMRDFVA